MMKRNRRILAALTVCVAAMAAGCGSRSGEVRLSSEEESLLALAVLNASEIAAWSRQLTTIHMVSLDLRGVTYEFDEYKSHVILVLNRQIDVLTRLEASLRRSAPTSCLCRSVSLWHRSTYDLREAIREAGRCQDVVDPDLRAWFNEINDISICYRRTP